MISVPFQPSFTKNLMLVLTLKSLHSMSSKTTLNKLALDNFVYKCKMSDSNYSITKNMLFMASMLKYIFSCWHSCHGRILCIFLMPLISVFFKVWLEEPLSNFEQPLIFFLLFLSVLIFVYTIVEADFERPFRFLKTP